MAFTEITQAFKNPLDGAELMSIIGISADDLNIQGRAGKVQEISRYLETIKNPKYTVLKLVQGKNSADKLEVVWSWVQLQKERERHINQLNPQDFTPDIEEQLRQKYLSRDKMKDIKASAQKQLQEQQELRKRIKDEHKTTEAQRKAEEAIIKKVEKLNKAVESVNQLELVTDALQYIEK